MTDTNPPLPLANPAEAPTDRLVQHLSRQPYDLIDARRLMRVFRASALDFQQALNQLEQLPDPQKNAQPA